MRGALRNGSEPGCVRFLMDRGFDPFEIRDHFFLHSDINKSLEEMDLRKTFIWEYGFAVLTKGIIEAIRPYSPILEIGAGAGYWAYELDRHGVDIIATDINVTDRRRYFGHVWENIYFEIKTLNSMEAVVKYPGRTLMTVWPDYNDSWAADALDLYTGGTVIYVGEGRGGCTADDRFHEILEQRFSNQEEFRVPQFWGLHDYMRICKRTKQLEGGKWKNMNSPEAECSPRGPGKNSRN